MENLYLVKFKGEEFLWYWSRTTLGRFVCRSSGVVTSEKDDEGGARISR